MAALSGLPMIDKYNGLDIKNMTLNSAYMVMNTSLNDIGVYVLRDNCMNCPYKLEVRPTPNVQSSWLFDTSARSTWRILNKNTYDELPTNDRSGLLCEVRPDLGEFGVYRVLIGRCEAREELAPVNSYMPFLLLLTILLSAYFICGFIKYLNRRKVGDDEITTKTETENVQQTDSLQVCRGILMTLLIFSSYGGGGYPLFNVQWGGLTMSDVIYLLYSWSVGVFIPIFVEDARNKGRSKWCIVKYIFLRSVILLLLGTMIDSTIQDKNRISLWRPLQRLSIAYFIVGTAYVLTVQNYVLKSKRILCKMAESVVSLLWCWILSGFLLAIIVVLISTFASFNCVVNVQMSDMKFDHSGMTNNDTESCSSALSESANVIFVATAKKMINVNFYVGFSKGLLGIMTTMMTAMIGLKSGNVFVRCTTHGARIKMWNYWGLLFLISAGVLIWVKYALQFNLLPISAIIIIPTIGMYLLILVYFLTEILKFPKIFKPTGLTSVAILTGHLLFSNSIPFVWGIELNTHILYLLQNIWTVLLWVVISVVLVKKNVKMYL